jgi:hypothetical protein
MMVKWFNPAGDDEMVRIISRQVVYEVHEYDLTPEEYRDFKRIRGNANKQSFLDDIGGSPAEYESMMQFKFSVEHGE